MATHFCTCSKTECLKHPGNHAHGCDPCIQSNLAQKKMPTCFFKAVRDDIDSVTEYTFDGFADFIKSQPRT